MRRLLVVAAAAACLPAPAAAAGWVGTYRLPASAAPVAISLEVSGKAAFVSLGPGHAHRQRVTASRQGSRLRFTLPGGVVFDGSLSGTTLRGKVGQARLRGTFSLRRGGSPLLGALGLYRSAGGAAVAIASPGAGLPTWLVELPSGDIHGLPRSLQSVGAHAGDTTGDGSLRIASGSVTWTRNGKATRYARVRLRQREVRIGRIAATLTLPDGPGPFPAVAMVHGSGEHGREEFQVFSAFCASLGVAVLADDKRGIGESGGTYPGERALTSTVDVLARDAQAEARYLAGLPEVDPARVGLLGDSQAGWIIALAAARDHAIRWAVPLAGPTVSVGETELWGSLAGQGATPPSASNAQMTAQVQAGGRSGFDPEASLRKLSIPVHWVFADDDRNVPTQLCVDRLQRLQAGHEFSWTVVHATHTLLELPTGLNADIPRSRGFARAMFPAVADFLREQRIVR